MNKNQLRESLRKQLTDASYLDTGVERIVDQVVNPKTYSVFMPKIEDVVYKFLGIEKPVRENNGTCEYKDLLPIDLDPVSPESDKNSLKDVSLDSVDANMKIKKKEDEEEKDEEEEKLEPPGVEREKEEEEKEEEKPRLPIIKIPEYPEVVNNNQAEIVAEKLPEPETQVSCPGLNDSIKSEDKTEDDEDESPPFEPIESINFNESNDSHLSGISELTSHRSRSPDFLNDFSRDNTDFSNHDSQFSKVSSDSRLSIVTDFGSSNPVPTPVSDNLKDENSKDKLVKDNFMEIREEMSSTEENNSSKLKEINLEVENENDNQNSKNNFSSKESSRDGTDNGKEKLDVKERHKSRDSSRSKSSNERSDSRESRHKDSRRKSSHSESKSDSKNKFKDKIDNLSEKIKEKSDISGDKLKEKSDVLVEKIKEVKDSVNKIKDEKLKEGNGRESKDLKDIYKEKIRELREKKELTEKEKANNDGKELKDDNKITVKDSRDSKKDSSRDKKEHHRRSHSSSQDGKSSRSSSKNSKSESKDRSKHDDHRHSGSRESKKRHSSESSEKIDSKKSSKSDKDDKSKSHRKYSHSSSSKSGDKYHDKNRDKSDSEGRDKKRRDVKKSKSKDDHSSLRNNSTDRRSSDRDGSNGSNGKNSQKNTSSPGSGSSTKAVSSSSSKESSNAGNSSSETSDGIEESQTELIKTGEKVAQVVDDETPETVDTRKIDIGQNEISLPLKKRPLQSDKDPGVNTVIVKKPKFARNFQEAKKLMKIRKQMDKEERKSQSPVENSTNHMAREKINLDEKSQSIGEKDKTMIDKKSKLSEMESSIRESLTEMISGENVQECGDKTADKLIQDEEKEENLIDKNIASTSKEHRSSIKSKKNNKKDAKDVEKLLDTSSNLSGTSENNFGKRKLELSDDEEDCRYFIPDNSHLNKYRKFLKSLNLREFDGIEYAKTIEVNTMTMAPPKSKRKYSTSPLSDIFLNNSNNNNESGNLKIDDIDYDDSTKKKRGGRPKKQQRTTFTTQTTMNGENFIMPLSPDSDVSATSDKVLSTNLVKEEKNRSRGSNQRYTSDDLYKPRPLFASSSKRSRRSNQA